MNIKKSSWHYRFIMSHLDTCPKTLCSYFWVLIGYMTMWTLLWWLFGIIWVAVIVEEWGEARDRRLGEKLKEKKEPGLIRTWVSAKKQKVCPIIKVV